MSALVIAQRRRREVYETNAPPEAGRWRGLAAGNYLVFEGQQAALPAWSTITLLQDADGDGRAEIRTVFVDGLARRSAWVLNR